MGGGTLMAKKVNHGARAIYIAAAIVAGSLLTIATPANAAKTSADHAYGPEPTWQAFRELAETRIRNSLIDPDSAKISWTHGFRKGFYKPFLESKVFGYATCGHVNARNRMGGYTGTAMFVVVIDYDRVLYSEIGKPDGDLLTDGCLKGMREGLLPRLADGPVSSDQPTTASGGGFDFTTSAVPEGAYVNSVITGGAAERAGLKPGMVITDLNGVSLKGMDATTTNRLLQAVSGEAALMIIGIGSVKLRKRPPDSSSNLLPINLEGM